ncbi:2-dehydro-3-deoxy-D-gluconate 5-dehydrogenase KduD [Desmospora activa]|uniref:2-deoxy-D-gluconate 3-dehydrogenase n=1 Tax=Desmospora activa DSM 45169 TaxID=1121389 RepID=A0A2T4ZDM5_9BACL|nr:2-dehydro-3-deoxy-D-gluconate 5-dehydrogenase KduD [Desmospora activa]PTM59990.1 2-deoxy-D-gluconate 3-dehydrogenase [Desmospora activa DSM 45169]
MGSVDWFSLEGKTALVTGARTGIGQAIAVGLAQAGADLILHGHRDNMQETEERIAATGRSCRTILIDLSDPAGVKVACENQLAGADIDILVNNAGIIRRSPAAKFQYEDWQEVIDTNLNSLFLLTQLLAQPMLRRGAGKIINIASLLSFQGGITVPSYTASKHAVAGLTKALANEWAPLGVQVNAIAPGYIATNNTEALRKNEERNEQILSRIPAGRWGKPDDLVGAALFLASAASNYVNGHVLVVDGGWMGR